MKPSHNYVITICEYNSQVYSCIAGYIGGTIAAICVEGLILVDVIVSVIK